MKAEDTPDMADLDALRGLKKGRRKQRMDRPNLTVVNENDLNIDSNTQRFTIFSEPVVPFVLDMLPAPLVHQRVASFAPSPGLTPGSRPRTSPALSSSLTSPVGFFVGGFEAGLRANKSSDTADLTISTADFEGMGAGDVKEKSIRSPAVATSRSLLHKRRDQRRHQDVQHQVLRRRLPESVKTVHTPLTSGVLNRRTEDGGNKLKMKRGKMLTGSDKFGNGNPKEDKENRHQMISKLPSFGLKAKRESALQSSNIAR